MNMPTTMIVRHKSIVLRRPTRSASRPRNTEPMAMPINSIASTMPSAARSMPHSAAMPGDAKLIDSTSKPSSAFSMTVIATAATCMRLIGDRDISSSGSLLTVSVLALCL